MLLMIPSLVFPGFDINITLVFLSRTRLFWGFELLKGVRDTS